MPRAVRVMGWAAMGVGIAAYAVLAHYVTARSAQVGEIGIALAAAPYLGFALLLAWRSPRRYLMFTVCAVAAVLLWRYAAELVQHFGWLYFLQHVGANVLLAVLFGRTLGHDREPLCSRLAAITHGRLDEKLARYTRQVTIAWTAFFAATAALSILLFVAAPIAVWSAFANVLSLPLVALMFAAEYAVRLRRLPDIKHVTILDTVRMYWNSSRVSQPPAP
jgi:uncharacterized membrane protein